MTPAPNVDLPLEPLPLPAPPSPPSPPSPVVITPVLTAAAERQWMTEVQRVIGVFLAVLLPIHFYALFIHQNIGAVNAVDETLRLQSRYWRDFEWVVINLGLLHATLSLRLAILDRPLSDRAKETWSSAAYVVAVLMAIAATYLLQFAFA